MRAEYLNDSLLLSILVDFFTFAVFYLLYVAFSPIDYFLSPNYSSEVHLTFI